MGLADFLIKAYFSISTTLIPRFQSCRIAREKVEQLLSTLPPRDRNVLRFRYGIVGPKDGPYTLNEVGALYGLKGERIRQIEGIALNRLRFPERTKALNRVMERSNGLHNPGSLV